MKTNQLTKYKMKKKDDDKIRADVKALITNFLLGDFKTRKGLKIKSIDNINFYEIVYDEENVGRNKIAVSSLVAGIKVWVSFVEDSTSSDGVMLKINKPIIFVLNPNSDEFELESEDAPFFDVSEY